MNNKVKFHLIASILNVLVFLLANYINYFVANLWDEKFGIRASSALMFIQSLYAYLFFWLFTFTIYLYKNPKKHILIFLLLSIMIVILYENYLIFIAYELQDRGTLFVLDSLTLALYDTGVFIIVATIGIYFNQLILGRKLLPEKYVSN